MSQSERVHSLAEVALFQGLTERQLAWVTERLYRRKFPAGALVITADQPGEVIYLVLEGTLKIHVEQPDGADVILAILGSGEVVGEMSLVDSAGRSASVVTLEDSELLWMNKADFRSALERFPQIPLNLIQIFSARLRLANAQIQALASLDVYGRVARQLLAFGERYGQSLDNGATRISVRLTQSEIADLIGASRKRVNQVMVALKSEGLLMAEPDGHLVLLDGERLAGYCL